MYKFSRILHNVLDLGTVVRTLSPPCHFLKKEDHMVLQGNAATVLPTPINGPELLKLSLHIDHSIFAILPKMCSGRSENTARKGLPSASDSTVSCELCGKRAALYCPADDAFLCSGCDRRVHTANFLALRHVRRIFCQACRSFTQRYVVGASMELKLPMAMVMPAQGGADAKTSYNQRTQKQPIVFL